jgi:hypothetical protein
MKRFVVAVGLTMLILAVGTFLRPAMENDRVRWRE